MMKRAVIVSDLAGEGEMTREVACEINRLHYNKFQRQSHI